jgi:diaminopimelate epimerase
MTITKAHAYGNDFLFAAESEVRDRELPALARTLCARHTGVGGDGLIVYGFTADGATMRLLVMRERERRGGAAAVATEVRAETGAGERRLMLTQRRDGRYTFRAAMGQPRDLQQETITAAGESLVVATLDIGNPQCVALMPSLPDAERFQRLGPALATHPRFAAGSNVEFAVVEPPGGVRILMWERGVGPTEASGTGACAAAITAMAYGGAARDVEVVSPGGTQRVEWTPDGVFLTGWAEILFDAIWPR